MHAPDLYGRTALHWAALNGHSATLNLLLDCNAPIEAADQAGCTALHLAAEKGYCKKIVVLLLQRGAAIDATDNRGATPLGRAVAKRHVAVVNLLWEYLCEGLSRDRRAVVATER